MDNYQITKGGAIVEIKDDGSVRQVGRINEQGQLESNEIQSSKSNSGSAWTVFAFLLAGAIIIVLGIEYGNLRNEYDIISYKNSTLSSEVSTQNDSYSDLYQKYNSLCLKYNDLKRTVSSKYPLIIDDVSIANTYQDGTIETSAGNTLYSSRTMYLTPVIQYSALQDGSYTLNWKLYYPDGTLSTGTSSPQGFSTSAYISIVEGAKSTAYLGGWGNSSKGSWRAGTYRIEIWYGTITCLANKSFTIY